MSSEICAKCSSDKIVPNVKIVNTMHHMFNLSIEVYEEPDAMIMKKGRTGSLSARVCASCGYTELFVSDPRGLWELHQRAVGDARGADE